MVHSLYGIIVKRNLKVSWNNQILLVMVQSLCLSLIKKTSTFKMSTLTCPMVTWWQTCILNRQTVISTWISYHFIITTVKVLNSGHLRIFKKFSVIKRCPLLGCSLTKIVTFGTKHFVRYSRHVRFLGCPHWEFPLYIKYSILYSQSLKARRLCSLESDFLKYFTKMNFMVS